MLLVEPPWLTQVKERLPHDEAVSLIESVLAKPKAHWNDPLRVFTSLCVDGLVQWEYAPRGIGFWQPLWRDTPRPLYPLTRYYLIK